MNHPHETSNPPLPVVFVQGGGPGAHAADRPLARSLQCHLGTRYHVRFPQMPHEGDPDFEVWKPRIIEAMSPEPGDLLLVGHSVGAYLVLKLLTEDGAPSRLRGLFLIAPPFPGGDPQWQIEGFSLPESFGARLPREIPIILYHSPDDATVPIAHQRRYAQAIPGAIVRETMGGHQLNNDLALVASDITRLIPFG